MKKFTILEKESNGKFARMSTYNTRSEATKVLSKIFRNDANADPQNFKIKEEEVESQSEFEQTINELMGRISHFSSKFAVEEITMSSEGRQYATLIMTNDGIDIWTSTALRAIMDCLGDKARFTIAFNPDTGRLEMLIIENT